MCKLPEILVSSRIRRSPFSVLAGENQQFAKMKCDMMDTDQDTYLMISFIWPYFYCPICDFRADEEGVSRQTVAKQMREMTNQLQELHEDLESEKEARNKAEKLKRDLNEVNTLSDIFHGKNIVEKCLQVNLFFFFQKIIMILDQFVRRGLA